MTANSRDTLVAGILIGASLMLIGQGVIWAVREEWFARRSVRKAERTLGLSDTASVQQERAAAPIVRHLDGDEYWAHIVKASECVERAQRPRLSSVAPVVRIPRQGSPGAWS